MKFGAEVAAVAVGLLIRHELNMSTVRPEPVEGLCFDRLSTNGLANKPGRINNWDWFG